MSDEPARANDEEADSMKAPNWVKLVTGRLVDPNTGPPPPISVSEWLSRQCGCLEGIRSAELHLARLREDLAALEALAVSRRDLRQAARAETLRTTPVVVPERPVEELVRVRVREQFAAEHERLFYVGNPGDVHDLPLGLVERLGDRLVRVSPRRRCTSSSRSWSHGHERGHAPHARREDRRREGRRGAR